MMDLNGAVQAAHSGEHVRDPATMREGWTMSFVKEENLLYYFNPTGERAHKVRFSDAQRASFQWTVIKRNDPCPPSLS